MSQDANLDGGRDIAARIGVALPIFLAPMAGEAAKPGLVAAVSNAGGLGVLGGGYLAPERLREAIRNIRALTPHPFGVNLFAPPDTPPHFSDAAELLLRLRRYHDALGIAAPLVPAKLEEDFHAQLAVILEERVPVFSFTFNRLPDGVMSRLHEHGITVMGTATTVAEARDLARSGVDAVVAQGAEAGGHRGTYLEDFLHALVGTMSLVPQVADAIGIPVVAAGGIADRRGVRAAFALGAQAVSVGTAFLTTDESEISAAYKRALLDPAAAHTAITRVFSGRPARGLRNRFMAEMRDLEARVPAYPLTNASTRAMRQAAALEGHAELLSLWAGQSAPLARSCSVAELMAELKAGLA